MFLSSTYPHLPHHELNQWLYSKQSGRDNEYDTAMQFLMLIALTLYKEFYK